MDIVKCCNCDWQGYVKIGAESCPMCKKAGCLAWIDVDTQTTSDIDDVETEKPKECKYCHGIDFEATHKHADCCCGTCAAFYAKEQHRIVCGHKSYSGQI